MYDGRICEKLCAEERDGTYMHERCSKIWTPSNMDDKNDQYPKVIYNLNTQ